MFRLTNIRGALITMPHKVTTVDLLDEVTATVGWQAPATRSSAWRMAAWSATCSTVPASCAACSAGGLDLRDKRVLVVGSGGVGSAIAASLAGAGIASITLYDVNAEAADALAARIIRTNYPQIEVRTGSNDPVGCDLVVNATPMGMKAGDPLPLDVSRLAPGTFVGEVVMASEVTAFLAAARERGCRTQLGSDMLFEQIPAYLEYFGLPGTTAEQLRSLARLSY